jgi:glycosyltransferase involved in cell wall biosynthesis
MRFSIVVPTYEMFGKGLEFAKKNLESIKIQTFKDYEIVIVDQSHNDDIYNLSKNYESIKFVKNLIPGMAVNLNCGIRNISGELIKILFQDEYFANENVLQTINDNFKPEDNWLFTGCSGYPNPSYNKTACTLGTPSLMTMRNIDPLFFDETFVFAVDFEYYNRMYERYGLPKIIQGCHIIIGLGDHQVTNHTSQEVQRSENARIIELSKKLKRI